MAVSRRFGLGAFTITLLLAGCGDSGEGGGREKDAGDRTERDATTGSGQDGGAGPLINIEIAKLDDNTAGALCAANSDCKGTGAYCLDQACSGVCETNKDCGKGGTCVQPFAGQNGLCSKLCTENADCDKGQDCRAGLDFDDFTAAVETAAQEAGIGTIDAGIELRNVPKTCGASLGIVELPDGVVGKACSDDTPCAPGECAPSVNIVELFPAGYCTGKCLVDKDCGAGGVCYKDPITGLFGTDGRCLLGCSTSATCRSGQVCRTSAFIDTKMYCLPPVATATDAGVTNDI
jgi:hypothetical protein